jgi:predicted nucleotidyltransferase
MEFESQKEIYRIATASGNSSHVILPKDWEGHKILLTRVDIEPKEAIMNLLSPYLKDIIGIYLYGSYARKENKEGSDIDVIVITNKKIKVEKKKPFDLIQIERDKINTFKRINPVLFYSFVFESESIINNSFLEDLRKEQINKDFFKEFFNDTNRVISINQELLELDKSQNQEYTDNNLIYSLILRLRAVYIIETLLKREKFSNNFFLKFLRNNLVHNPDKYYEVYQNIRNDKKIEKKITIGEAEKLLNLLNEVTSKLNNAK